MAFGQVAGLRSMTDIDEYGFRKSELGEDTVIVMSDMKRDTVYTIDAIVMDMKPDKIALGEMYYPLDIQKVVALDKRGNSITLEFVPIKATVRVRLTKRGRQFLVTRIRVLSLAK